MHGLNASAVTDYYSLRGHTRWILVCTIDGLVVRPVREQQPKRLIACKSIQLAQTMFPEMEERKVTPMPIKKWVRLGVASEAIWVCTRTNAHQKGAQFRTVFSRETKNAVNCDAESRKLRVLERRGVQSCRR